MVSRHITISELIDPDSLCTPRWVKNKLEGILITEGLIVGRVKRMAEDISHDYKLATRSYRERVERDPKEKILLITILEGAKSFSSMLAFHLPGKIESGNLRVSSYEGTESKGAIDFRMEPDTHVAGRDILLAEDIIDTGFTMSYLIEALYARGARTIKVCTLLDKPSRRLVDVQIDYTGFVIPDVFVVGFGMDYNRDYRNLPFIGVMKG